MARAIHLIEADRPNDALAATREVPVVAGPFGGDWGHRHTLQPRVRILEAEILARLKRPAEAEAAAVDAPRAAPYDVAPARRG